MTLDEQITFFFAPPDPLQSGTRSSLHALRREVQDSLIGEVGSEDLVVDRPEEQRHRLFATAMVLWAGIDLLGKFYAGDDKRDGVTRRFVGFVRDFMVMGAKHPEDVAKLIYEGGRNPMVHSFTLHSQARKLGLVSDGQRYAGALLWRPKSDPARLFLSLEGLFTAFVKATRSYEAELRKRAGLRANFERMFPNYGSLPMGDVGDLEEAEL